MHILNIKKNILERLLEINFKCAMSKYSNSNDMICVLQEIGQRNRE